MRKTTAQSTREHQVDQAAQRTQKQHPASVLDRLWFEAHPGATARLRPFMEGELPLVLQERALVLIYRLAPRRRLRVLLDPHQELPAVLSLGDDGELMGPYRDLANWDDALTTIALSKHEPPLQASA